MVWVASSGFNVRPWQKLSYAPAPGLDYWFCVEAAWQADWSLNRGIAAVWFDGVATCDAPNCPISGTESSHQKSIHWLYFLLCVSVFVNL